MTENNLVPNRFLNTKFAQQRLPAFRPIMSPLVAIVGLSIVTIISFVFGGLFYASYKSTPLYSVRYDNKATLNTHITVDINVENDLEGDLVIYYKLTNFYQNHRRYMESRNYYQLSGSFVEYKDLSLCKPWRSVDDSPEPSALYLPSGLAPITVFNDTFDVSSLNPDFSKNGIVFNADKKYYITNLSSKYTTGKFWLSEGIYKDLFPDAQNDERFIAWMRFATLPTFMKKWAICKGCRIPKGIYKINISNYYDTSFFGGEKWFVLSKISGIGSNDNFLAAVYFFLGSLSLVLIIGIIVERVVFPRKFGDPELIRKFI